MLIFARNNRGNNRAKPHQNNNETLKMLPIGNIYRLRNPDGIWFSRQVVYQTRPVASVFLHKFAKFYYFNHR